MCVGHAWSCFVLNMLRRGIWLGSSSWLRLVGRASSCFPRTTWSPCSRSLSSRCSSGFGRPGTLKQMHGFLWRKLPLLSRWPPCSKLWRQWFIRMTAPASLPSPGGRLAQQCQGGYTLHYHCAKTLHAQALKLRLREAICVMKVNAEASWQQVGPAELRRQFPADLRKAAAAIGVPACAF